MKVEVEAGDLVVHLADESETETLGRAIAGLADPGLVIGLIGGLGAGKTRLARAVAEALGVDPGAISSPTFVLVHEYDGRLSVYHFDTYRLNSPDEFDALGAAETFGLGGVCLVEWADRVLDRLPADAWLIRLEPTGLTGRRATIRGPGSDLGRLADRLGSV